MSQVHITREMMKHILTHGKTMDENRRKYRHVIPTIASHVRDTVHRSRFGYYVSVVLDGHDIVKKTARTGLTTTSIPWTERNTRTCLIVKSNGLVEEFTDLMFDRPKDTEYIMDNIVNHVMPFGEYDGCYRNFTCMLPDM